MARCQRLERERLEGPIRITESPVELRELLAGAPRKEVGVERAGSLQAPGFKGGGMVALGGGSAAKDRKSHQGKGDHIDVERH